MAQSLMLNRFDVQQRMQVVERDSNFTSYTSAISYAPESTQEYHKLLPIYFHSSANSEYADGFNDGYHWQGRGLNQAILFGVQGRWKQFEYTIAPMLSYSQNLAYDYRSGERGRPPYQYVFTDRIDYVMRYGEEAKTDLFLGQTELAYNWKNIRLSLGTNNMWWGSGVYQSALMSNHAPGFPHLQIGNSEPWRGRFGAFSFQWFSGYLRESDFLTADTSDDTRAFDALILSYQPSFFEGLNLTFGRVMHFYTDGFQISNSWKLFEDFFRTTQHNGGTSSTAETDQMYSLGLDWSSNTDNFRVYFEWVRGDFSRDLENYAGVKDYLVQNDYNSGIILGFIKKFLIGQKRQLILNYEYSNMSTWETADRVPDTILNQGYTHRGQIMGASIGPGSRFDALSLSYQSEPIHLIFEYMRTRFNDDIFHLELSQEVDYQDTQHFLGLHAQKKWNQWEVQAGIGIGLRSDFNYVPGDYRQNIQPQLILRYRL